MIHRRWETTGGVLGPLEVRNLLARSESVSLGELDPSKILDMRDEYLEKVLTAMDAGRVCNGHAIGLGPLELNMYAAGHLTDDHECVTYEELLNRLRVGISVFIREGSSERNGRELLAGVAEHKLPTEHIMFCTDDKHVQDIAREGHISYNVQLAIDAGIDPVEAIQMATINTARHFRVEDRLGSLTPGRLADLMLLPDLKTIRPSMVLKDGRVVAENGIAVKTEAKDYPAHLHIDLLPECQGQGYGRKLIMVLIEHLKANHITGLMLHVSMKNEGARAFYKKCGFHILYEDKKDALYGIKLGE